MPSTHEHSERAFAAVSAELDQERASALSRAGRRVEQQSARCRVLGELLDLDPDRADLLAEYRAARAEFDRLRWRFQVQREAVGLLDQRWMDRHYPMPARR